MKMHKNLHAITFIILLGFYSLILINCGGSSKEPTNPPPSQNFTLTVYTDADGDGYGDPNTEQEIEQETETPPSGLVLDNNDCDDTNAKVNPGEVEIFANNIDDDCKDNKRTEKTYNTTTKEYVGDGTDEQIFYTVEENFKRGDNGLQEIYQTYTNSADATDVFCSVEFYDQNGKITKRWYKQENCTEGDPYLLLFSWVYTYSTTYPNFVEKETESDQLYSDDILVLDYLEPVSIVRNYEVKSTYPSEAIETVERSNEIGTPYSLTTYDEDRKIISILSDSDGDGDYIQNLQNTYTYNADGLLESIKYEEWNGAAFEETSTITYFYNSDGNLIKEVRSFVNPAAIDSTLIYDYE